MLLSFNQITAGRTPPSTLGHLARDLASIHAGGWPAVELWLRHWDAPIAAEGLAAARRALADSGLGASGGCAQPGLLFSEGAALDRYQGELRHRLEQCQALGAAHLVVTPGPAQTERPLIAADLERAAENLRVAGDIAAGCGVRLGIEFLKGVRLVNNLPTALQLAARVDHPNVGVLVDTFHLYAGLSKVEDLDLFTAQPERLTFVHVNDVPASIPRELWADSDRILPGEGAFPLEAMFRAFAAARYGGYVSLELFNDAFAAAWADDPVAAARRAYASVTPLVSAHAARPVHA